MIPLVGCKVRFIFGPFADQEGTVTGVEDFRHRLQTLSEDEARLFVRAQRASHGDGWDRVWFHATVQLDLGKETTAGPNELLPLTEGLVRSKAYTTL